MQAPDLSPTAASTTSGGEYPSFRLDAEGYGIDILKVQELRGHGSPTGMDLIKLQCRH
jgi:chemotaxis signal transduction protein